MLELDEEGVRTKAKILRLLAGRQSDLGALDGIATPGQHSVQGKDVYGNLAFLVEVGELLDAERVPILNPALGRGTHPCIRPHGCAKATGNGGTAEAQVGKVDFQHLGVLIRLVGVIVFEAAVQHNLVLTLVVLELDDSGSEVISCTLYHS